MKSTKSYVRLLHDSNLKATPGRLHLLEILGNETKPRGIDFLKKKLKKSDSVTLYRNLESFVAAGIVERLDIRHGHADYELTVDRYHHHHIVCTSCNFIEDIKKCSEGTLRESKKFSQIDSHSIVFFGICKNCTAKKSKNSKH